MTIAGPLLTEDQDRPYEYRTFRVGDRVRVRLSPECRTLFEDTRFDTKTPHGQWEDGVCGTIAEIDAPGLGLHPYFVLFEEIQRGEGSLWEGCNYASSELEPVDPEAQGSPPPSTSPSTSATVGRTCTCGAGCGTRPGTTTPARRTPSGRPRNGASCLPA